MCRLRVWLAPAPYAMMSGTLLVLSSRSASLCVIGCCSCLSQKLAALNQSNLATLGAGKSENEPIAPLAKMVAGLNCAGGRGRSLCQLNETNRPVSVVLANGRCATYANAIWRIIFKKERSWFSRKSGQNWRHFRWLKISRPTVVGCAGPVG